MVEVRSSAVFDAWFDALRDRQAQARITVRIRRLQEGNPASAQQHDVRVALRLAKEL